MLSRTYPCAIVSSVVPSPLADHKLPPSDVLTPTHSQTFWEPTRSGAPLSMCESLASGSPMGNQCSRTQTSMKRTSNTGVSFNSVILLSSSVIGPSWECGNRPPIARAERELRFESRLGVNVKWTAGNREHERTSRMTNDPPRHQMGPAPGRPCLARSPDGVYISSQEQQSVDEVSCTRGLQDVH